MKIRALALAYLLAVLTPLAGSAQTQVNQPSSTSSGGVSYGSPQSLTSAQKQQAQSNLFIAPTVTRLLSGSGVYNPPAGVTYLVIEESGGGSGGSGGGTGAGSGGAGGATTFSTSGGTALLTANGASGTTGGSVTVGSGPVVLLAYTGGSGLSGGNNNGSGAFLTGTTGGTNPLGGTGASSAAIANSGGGGGGGATSNGSTQPVGNSGAAGGYLKAIIASPASAYNYVIGPGGSGGTAGSGGGAGTAGGSGVIIIEEHYGS